MNWRPVKEFLKPDKRRIAIFVVALFFLMIFFESSPLGYDFLGYEPSFLDEILGKLWGIAFLINLLPMAIFWSFSSYPIILIISLILFWYLISCGIAWIFENSKKKN